MGPRSKVILFYQDDKLVGHALLLVDGETLRWLYVGREVAANDGLYLYIAQTVVETAILLGAKRLEMGLTTYPIKQDLGAEVTPIKIALRATWGSSILSWGWVMGCSTASPILAQGRFSSLNNDSQNRPV